MQAKKEKRVMTAVYVNADMYRELMDIRWDIKMSFNAIVREALDKWLKEYKINK